MTAFGIRFQSVPDAPPDIGIPIWIRLENPWQGWWLERYDPDGREGNGLATFTQDCGNAMRFESFDAAKECWFQQSAKKPYALGIDGKQHENRPLAVVSFAIDDPDNPTIL